jgi:molybdenum cofactor synthesis domain-containing protein
MNNDESPLVDAQKKFIEAIAFRSMADEPCALPQAMGRVLHADVICAMDSPPYPRAIAEGFAVNTADTQAASEQRPVTFTVAGEVKPGDTECPQIKSLHGLRVSTGSLLTDAPMSVVRMWDCTLGQGTFTITRPFPPRFFIEERGCDIKQGDVLIAAGTILTPMDLGNAAAQGLSELPVARRPKVAVFSSGDEVIPHAEPMRPGAIRDSNSVMLSAAVTQAGGMPEFCGIMNDDLDHFIKEAGRALKHSDMLLISGGTAAGGTDFIADLVRTLGELLVDGVPMRSGKPLIMGISQGKPVVCVAGHPPEALRGFRLFGVAAINQLLGRQAGIPEDTQ